MQNLADYYLNAEIAEMILSSDTAGMLISANSNGEIQWKCVSNEEFYLSQKEWAIRIIKQQPFF